MTRFWIRFWIRFGRIWCSVTRNTRRCFNVDTTSYRCWKKPLREKCPNTECFLVRSFLYLEYHIFLYLDWIRRFKSKTLYSFQIQENRDQKKSPFWTLFTQWTRCVYRDLCATDVYLTMKKYIIGITWYIINISTKFYS